MFGNRQRMRLSRAAWAGAAGASTCTILPPAIVPPRQEWRFKEQQRKMRRDWVLEHILVVILIPLVVAIAVIIVLMIAGYR